MDEQAKPILTLAKAGLILRVICSAVTVAVQVFAEPLTSLLHNPVTGSQIAAAANNPLGYVMPMAGLGVYILFYVLLRNEIRRPTAFSGTLLILIFVSLPVMSLISAGYSMFLNMLYVRLYDVESYAALAQIKSYSGIISGVFGSLTYPMLAAAAGMNRQRANSGGIQI